MQGEALFNDGVGIVLFTILLRFALDSGGDPSPSAIIELLLLEAGGGLLLGLATGYVAYRGMQLLDDYPIEVLISLALVTGTYALAQKLHMSGPLAVVAAGLLIGDRGPRYAMSDRTQTYVFALWTLIDEILNSVLFLLIGLEVLVLRFEPFALVLAGLTIPIVLLARLVAVSVPPVVFAWSKLISVHNVPFPTWAGVRGGISVALVLRCRTTGQTGYACRDLRRRPVQHHHSGLDARKRGALDRQGRPGKQSGVASDSTRPASATERGFHWSECSGHWRPPSPCWPSFRWRRRCNISPARRHLGVPDRGCRDGGPGRLGPSCHGATGGAGGHGNRRLARTSASAA